MNMSRGRSSLVTMLARLEDIGSGKSYWFDVDDDDDDGGGGGGGAGVVLDDDLLSLGKSVLEEEPYRLEIALETEFLPDIVYHRIVFPAPRVRLMWPTGVVEDQFSNLNLGVVVELVYPDPESEHDCVVKGGVENQRIIPIDPEAPAIFTKLKIATTCHSQSVGAFRLRFSLYLNGMPLLATEPVYSRPLQVVSHSTQLTSNKRRCLPQKVCPTCGQSV